MIYATPTTAEEMYSILKQIYYDYRLKIDAYEDAGLTDILLDRMTFTEKTDSELLEEARTLLYPWYDQELNKARGELEAKILACNNMHEETIVKKTDRIESLEEEIKKSKSEIEREALKKGFFNSSIMLDKLEALEEYRIDKLAEIEQEFLEKNSELSQEVEALCERLENLASDYEDYFNNKVQAKFIELKAEQEKIARDVFKYNNGLDEKEKRSKNANIQANASLKLRYLEIRTQSYSKEELVDMGYYKDVIDCVCAYYNTITDSLQAYKQFMADTKIVIYLEDYYENVLALYRSKAGL